MNQAKPQDKFTLVALASLSFTFLNKNISRIANIFANIQVHNPPVQQHQKCHN